MLKWLARGPWFVAVFATLFHFFYFDNSCMYNFNLFGLAPCIYPINIQLKKNKTKNKNVTAVDSPNTLWSIARVKNVKWRNYSIQQPNQNFQRLRNVERFLLSCGIIVVSGVVCGWGTAHPPWYPPSRGYVMNIRPNPWKESAVRNNLEVVWHETRTTSFPGKHLESCARNFGIQ